MEEFVMKQSESILEIIESSYPLFSKSEKDIAKYFINHKDISEDLSAESVSKILFSSKSALTRFAQKCGYKGYREFVFEYQFNLKYLKDNFESLKEMTAKILFEYNELMEKTKEIVNDEQLERIAQMIDSSKRVYFYGLGSSGLVAKEAKIRFMRLGVPCESITEAELINWTNCTLDKDCLIFGLSISGQTKTVINALEVATNKGAKTILLSSERNKKYGFTEQVLIATEKHLNYGNRISPQFPLILFVDIIYSKFKSYDSYRKESIYKESLEAIDFPVPSML